MADKEWPAWSLKLANPKLLERVAKACESLDADADEETVKAVMIKALQEVDTEDEE